MSSRIATSHLEGARPHNGVLRSDILSEVVRQVDAPLDPRHAADRQRFRWTQPESKDSQASQQAKVDSIKARIALARRELAEASKSVDRNDREPPHPDWATKHRLEKQIASLRKDLSWGEKLLEDMKKGVSSRKMRSLMTGPVDSTSE